MNQYIHRLDTNTSYEYFFHQFMVKNIVCIFDQKLTESWRSREEWVTSDGKPDLCRIKQLFGQAIVPISDCNQKYYNSNPKQDMILEEFINYWQNVQQSDYDYKESKILYLKDWHFMNEFPDYKPYEIPVYFESDWLNEYLMQNKSNDDYRFVYMGPKHSSTPLHTDVFGSFSWSANICGTKKWLIIPPGNESNLKILNNNVMPHDFYSLPNCMTQLESMKGFEVIQNSGEIIFIPSGFIHQVINVADTISINHNWFNACNIHNILDNILLALKDVESELSDLKNITETNEWNLECQTLLKLHFGFNLKDFIDCLNFISNRIEHEFKEITETSELTFRIKYERNTLLKLLTSNKSCVNLEFYKSFLKLIENKLNNNKCDNN